MKSLTPKQRGKIYLKVAEYFSTQQIDVICPVLVNKLDFCCIDMRGNGSTQVAMKNFEEFALFEPDDGRYVWFDDDNNARCICMLLCYEMTKTQKQ